MSRDTSAFTTLDNANMGTREDFEKQARLLDAARREGYAHRQPEIDALNEKVAGQKILIQIAARQVERLQGENERLRADAERYRWFKENYLKFGSGESDTLRPIILFDSKWYGGHFNNIDDLDTAIDAAMKDFSTTKKEERRGSEET